MPNENHKYELDQTMNRIFEYLRAVEMSPGIMLHNPVRMEEEEVWIGVGKGKGVVGDIEEEMSGSEIVRLYGY